MFRSCRRLFPLLLTLALLTGCGGMKAEEDSGYVDGVELTEVELEDEAVALAESPAALDSLLQPVASGAEEQRGAHRLF